MATLRVRVRRPASTRGLIALALLAGIALAVCVEVGHVVGWRFVSSFFPNAGVGAYILLGSILGAALLLGALAFAGFLGAVCQRIRAVFVVASVLVATTIWALVVADFLTPPYQAISPDPVEHLLLEVLAAVGAMLLLAPLFGGVAILVMLAERTFLWKVGDQDGTICVRCGYPVGATSSATCPECGASTDTAPGPRERVHRLTVGLGVRLRPIVTGFIALNVAVAAWLAFLERPVVRFQRTFASWAVGSSLAEYDPESLVAYAVTRERGIGDQLDDGTGVGLGTAIVRVAVSRNSAFSPLAMRISVELPAPIDEDGLMRFITGAENTFFTRVPRAVIPTILNDGIDDATLLRLLEEARRRHVSGESFFTEFPAGSSMVIDWEMLQAR